MRRNNIKIEIELQKSDKTIAGLIRAMGDEGFEAIVTTLIICFDSQKPEEWFTEERQKAFEEKFNKDVGDENVSYKILSIKKLTT